VILLKHNSAIELHLLKQTANYEAPHFSFFSKFLLVALSNEETLAMFIVTKCTPWLKNTRPALWGLSFRAVPMMIPVCWDVTLHCCVSGPSIAKESRTLTSRKRRHYIPSECQEPLRQWCSVTIQHTWMKVFLLL